MTINKLLDDFETSIDYNEQENIKAMQELDFDENKKKVLEEAIKTVCSGQRYLLNKMRNKFEGISEKKGCEKTTGRGAYSFICGHKSRAGNILLCKQCRDVAGDESK